MTDTVAMIKSKQFAPWLWLLFSLFLFRVCAQLLQIPFNIAFLPAFEHWHSATLPYGLLLTSQIVILILLGRVTYRFSQGKLEPKQRTGRIWMSLGLIYLSVMLFRLIMGLSFYSELVWFSRTLPTLFHIVLASFMLLVAAFHLQKGRRS